jgi:hypothetical protein
MTKEAWDYYSSGADDEITLRENHSAFARIWLRPRVLVDIVFLLCFFLSFLFYQHSLGRVAHGLCLPLGLSFSLSLSLCLPLCLSLSLCLSLCLSLSLSLSLSRSLSLSLSVSLSLSPSLPLSLSVCLCAWRSKWPLATALTAWLASLGPFLRVTLSASTTRVRVSLCASASFPDLFYFSDVSLPSFCCWRL